MLGNPLFLNRLIGKAIDLVIVVALASVIYPAGPLAAFLYCLIADGLQGGRSLGKRVARLYVTNTVTSQPADFKDSVIRNSPIALAVLFFLIPFWGWMLWIFIGIPILAIEVYLMRNLENQARLGDTMADTRVLEWVEV